MAQFVLWYDRSIEMVPKLVSRIRLICLAVVAALLWAVPASAGLCVASATKCYILNESVAFGAGTFGAVSLTQISSTDVQVTVTLASGENFAGTGAGAALTWDLTGNPTVSVVGLPSGFVFVAPAGGYGASSFGTFEYAVSCFKNDFTHAQLPAACQGGSGPTGPLTFDVTVSSGSLFVKNFISNGTAIFSVDIFNSNNCSGACTGPVGVPEPASVLLFSTGTAGFFALRRRRKKAAV